MSVTGLGKLLVLFGLVLVLLGVGLMLGERIPWLGRLPGDIRIERESFRIYFPITTGILVSLVLSLLPWLLRR